MANKIGFREDSSNRSTKYLRNKIRLGIIPKIREITPKFTDTMIGNINRLTDTQIFINHAIEILTSTICRDNNGVHIIDLERVDKAYPLNFVVYEILSSKYGFKGDVTDALCKAVTNASSGKRFYSKDWVAYVDRGQIILESIAEDDPCTVEVPLGTSRVYCGNSVLYFQRTAIDLIEDFACAENMAQIDADKLIWPLTLRKWREGDWFVPYGMSGRKKVSDFLIKSKVSIAEKNRQFVLVSGEDIVWLVGRRIDDRYKLTKQTEEVIKLKKEVF